MNKEDYFKYYIQGSDHYLIPKDIFNELFDEMSNWREEVKELNQKYLNAVADYETTMSELQELRKQLEEANEKIILLQASEPMLNYKKALEENQQKEFIEYLEKEKERCLTFYSRTPCMYAYDVFKDVLSKYQEIIGVSHE